MKKIISIILIIVLVIGVIAFIFLNFSTEVDNSVKDQNEIQPEEEVPEAQDYSTKIKLYFIDQSSGILTFENRSVDSRELIENPYLYVLNLLVKGPEIPGLINAIPERTKINSAKLEKGTLCVDLSEEFLNSGGTDSIYSIVNTVTQFNEIDSVKFFIDGKINDSLKEKFVRQK